MSTTDQTAMTKVLTDANDAAADKPSAFAGIVAEDAARRAALPKDEQEGTEQEKGTEEPIKPVQPPVLATPDLVNSADVPNFSATDALGRGLATEILQGEQRLRELADDIEASKVHRDSLADRVRRDLEDDYARARERAEGLMDEINNNCLQEVSILRGRETDVLRTVSALKSLAEVLKR